MTEPDPDRSTAARRVAELALVRVCHHYGARPEFVLIGGLAARHGRSMESEIRAILGRCPGILIKTDTPNNRRDQHS